MKKILPLIFIVLSNTFVLAQSNLNLRKVIQKSDLIIDIDDYRSDTIWINDFTYKNYIQMDKIDSTNSILLLNKLYSSPKKLTLREYTDDEDFYSNYSVNQECGCLGKTHEQDKSYSDLFFIRKEKNEYRIVMHLYGIESDQRDKYRHQIETIRDFENIKNEKERFIKTLDWFIENGLVPDKDFIEYYKVKGITNDTIQYSEEQIKNALQKFLNGKENLLPIVREKYFEEVKQFYIQKMESIVKIEKPKYGDYYNFDRAFRSLIGDEGLDYDSADYLLYNSLTSEKFDMYDKDRIMKYLIEIAKEWEK
ncbi:hypothetical protein ABF176_002510 [Flavobacterium psychrophilum]